MIPKTKLWFLSAGLLAAAAVAADGVMFAHRFEAESSQRYRVRITSEMEMTGMEVSQSVEMEATVKCLAVVEGKYAMFITFDKVDMSRVMMGKMESDPVAALMVGKSANFTVDAHGEVSEITPAAGFEAWADVQGIVEPMLKGWYSYLPAAEVAVGGEWEHEGRKETAASGAESVNHERFKFKEMRKEKGRECALVEELVESTIGGSRQTPMGTFALSGAGKGKYEFLFDPATAKIIKVKGAMDLDIDMTPEAGGDPMKTAVSNHVERELLE